MVLLDSHWRMLHSSLLQRAVAVTPVLGDSTNKEKAPFDRSRRTGFPCYKFFCGRCHKLVPIYRDSDMRRLRSTKILITAARPKWGPGFSTVPYGDQHKATAFSRG